MLLPKVDLNRLKKEVKEEAFPRLEFLAKILSPLIRTGADNKELEVNCLCHASRMNLD